MREYISFLSHLLIGYDLRRYSRFETNFAVGFTWPVSSRYFALPKLLFAYYSMPAWLPPVLLATNPRIADSGLSISPVSYRFEADILSPLT